MQLAYKDNWTEAREHLEAFWAGEYIDRPLTLLTAPRQNAPSPPPVPEDLEAKWTDLDYLLQLDEHQVRWTHWLGDVIPTGRTVLMGWCLNFGFPVTFQPDTIWIEHTLETWDEAIEWADRWRDPWFERMRIYTERACRQAAEKYFIGAPPILPPNDLLSMLRGGVPFLMDLVERPGVIRRNLMEMTAAHLEMHQALAAIRSRHQEGNLHHYRIWCPEYVGLWQSDVSAMISPDMFEEFIVPELEKVSEVFDKIIYHLDGPDAIRHVDSVCAIEKVHLIQWVPGTGNPGGAHWLDLFKRIQANGKAVLISGSHADIEVLIKELDPAKMVLQLGVGNLDDGNALIQRIAELTRRYHGGG